MQPSEYAPIKKLILQVIRSIKMRETNCKKIMNEIILNIFYFYLSPLPPPLFVSLYAPDERRGVEGFENSSIRLDSGCVQYTLSR